MPRRRRLSLYPQGASSIGGKAAPPITVSAMTEMSSKCNVNIRTEPSRLEVWDSWSGKVLPTVLSEQGLEDRPGFSLEKEESVVRSRHNREYQSHAYKNKTTVESTAFPFSTELKERFLPEF